MPKFIKTLISTHNLWTFIIIIIGWSLSVKPHLFIHCILLLAQEQDDSVLQEEIDRAHVVCVVYDITVENALDRVRTIEITVLPILSDFKNL